METYLSYYAQFQALLKNNPVVAGAFSLWGLTVLSWFARNLPSTIANFFSNQLTTSLTFNNSGWSGGNENQFNGFLAWFAESRWAKWSRNLSLDTKNWQGDKIIVSAGFGRHFFFYKGRLFWFVRRKLESSGTDKEKNELTILTLGRSQKPILQLVEDFRYRPDDSTIGIYIFKEEWRRVTNVRKRPLKTVVINRELKNKILKDIEYFINNQKWYDDRGMPYKMTYVFHGLPGTGKTSIISALASHFNRNVCVINLSSMYDDKFEAAMATVPPNSIVLIEDFDSSSSVSTRRGGFSAGLTAVSGVVEGIESIESPAAVSETLPALESTEKETSSFEFKSLSLTSVLNTLDGMVRLDDIIVMMTTNHLERIDPAVIRKGRVDHIYEIKHFENNEVREYINLMYPDQVIDPEYVFRSIAGCDIQALFLEHKEDYESFFNALPKIKMGDSHAERLMVTLQAM